VTRRELDSGGAEEGLLALAGSVLGLGGATIDSLQLLDLSSSLARELGIAVKDAQRLRAPRLSRTASNFTSGSREI
jgi:hypothetical protein